MRRRPSAHPTAALYHGSDPQSRTAAGVHLQPLNSGSKPRGGHVFARIVHRGLGGHFVVWQDSHGFHAQDVVRLTFATPQTITGAELYTTNYESFGTDSSVIADGTTAIPLRTVFLADNNPGGQNCWAGGQVVRDSCKIAN